MRKTLAICGLALALSHPGTLEPGCSLKKSKTNPSPNSSSIVYCVESSSEHFKNYGIYIPLSEESSIYRSLMNKINNLTNKYSGSKKPQRSASTYVCLK